MNNQEDGTNVGTFAYDYDDHDDVKIRDVNWEDYNDNDYIPPLFYILNPPLRGLSLILFQKRAHTYKNEES
jgi:hypothetical protein